MVRLIGEGCYRRVYSVGRYVIKIPKSFRGVLCNLVETYRYLRHRSIRPSLCPVVFPLFLFVIMPKIDILEESYWESSRHEVIRREFLFADNEILREDVQEGNLGIYSGRIVLVDYGGYDKGGVGTCR